MTIIGHVRDIVRYPVKSMAGVPTDSAVLGWHGLDGDRRFAFRRVGNDSGFPWLSASRLPELIRYQPIGFDARAGEPRPTHVRTPAGTTLELTGTELTAEIAKRFGAEVELMLLNHGTFDAAVVSLISRATIEGIGREAERDLDPRRFRANLIVETDRDEPFLEDAWVGRQLLIGDEPSGPLINVTLRDTRCVMIGLDPETAEQDARILRTVVRLNANDAGVYGTVVRQGTVRVGDRISLV